MIAGQPSITDTVSNPAPGAGYFDSTETKFKPPVFPYGIISSTTAHFVHSLRESCDFPFYGAILGTLLPSAAPSNYSQNGPPAVTSALNAFSTSGNNATNDGAFIGGNTTGVPGALGQRHGIYHDDGPYINKPDEGNYSNAGGIPYFADTAFSSSAGQTFFSPNRLMPSPVMFGSLPTGVIHNTPWQTLLFCPNPAGGNNHPGFGTPTTGSSGPSAGASIHVASGPSIARPFHHARSGTLPDQRTSIDSRADKYELPDCAIQLY